MIPPGLGGRTLPGKRFCKDKIIEQWITEAVRCGLNRKSCYLISEERQDEKVYVCIGISGHRFDVDGGNWARVERDSQCYTG